MQPGMDRKMMCRMCSDQRKVRAAADDAERILRRAKELFSLRRTGAHRHSRSEQRFYHPARCHWQGNSCPTFSQHLHELRRAEEQLEAVFEIVKEELHMLKERGEEDAVHRLRGTLFDLFRGHYPRAAQEIERA